MVSFRGGRLVAAAAFTLLSIGLTAQASADPISITSGQISFQRRDPATFTLVLTSGSLMGQSGDTSDPESAAPWPPYACNSCTPGATLNPSLTQEWTVSNQEGPFLDGNLVWNGTAYTLKSFSFGISADQVTVPSTLSNTQPEGGSSYGSSNASPFTMHGDIVGMAADGSLVGLTLFGGGNVIVGFIRDTSTLPISWFSTTYRFAQAPAATPEPATLLLLGGGVAAAFARRRKVRQELR
jgi:hypothetical protein